MRANIIVGLLFLSWVVAGVSAQEKIEQKLVEAPKYLVSGVWLSEPPADCPFKPSENFSGVEFTGRHAEYTGADTWYPSWASDGNMYSPWTDGNVNGLGSGSGGDGATTGHATILGDDPLKLIVTNQGVYKSSPRPYAGRYPCGSLLYDGVWYYSTYCLHPGGGIRKEDGVIYNWPWLGPVVGFRWSTDCGKTWTQTPCTPDKPLFGENALKGEPTKVGCPHFVDFGKNMEHSPDGKAYMVSHGASEGPNGRRYAYNSWITGDEIYLVRVKPSIESMNDASKYEFYTGNGMFGRALWTSDFKKIKPIAAWKDHMGCVTMTYSAPLKKYFMCVTDGGNTVSKYHTYILESKQITGPWTMAAYLKNFGEQAYFVNIPSKFIGKDGRTLWLCYAANFSSGWGGMTFRSNPPGSRYGMCFQELKLRGLNDSVPPAPVNPLDCEENVARKADVSASSVHPDYSVKPAIDGIVAGYPGDTTREWATRGETKTGSIKLTWKEEQTVDKIWLFDRPNELDHILAGELVFSDGTSIMTGELPDNAQKGLEVKFPAKKIISLEFKITKANDKALNLGLAEIAVFRAK